MNIYFTSGENMYDWFIIPTIRIDRKYTDITYITIEWLKWFIGFCIS